MQRSRVVPYEVRSQMEITGAHIILMQEPYTMASIIPGLGTSVAIVFRGDKSASPLVPVGIRENHIPALNVASLCTRHCACLDKVLLYLRGKRVIVGAGVNAKSPLWFCRELDQRGEPLDGLISQHGPLVLNRPCDVTTFEATRGKSIIDVTLVTPEALPLVQNWKLHEDGKSSDHRILETRLNLKKRKAPPPPLQQRYHARKANWEMFHQHDFEEKRNMSEKWIKCHADIESMVAELERVLTKVCSAAMPKKKWHEWSRPWWTQDLTRANRDAYRARRRFQRTKDPATRDLEEQRYR
ncbi:PREDICTED: uncharacterized protein LOC108549773 [Eufriesea mexicana]|uniref:uncharacterized protein LOC108549773 n=1 Tax=Eufriesea mexicana TaxID=516756 RepID=UPI00083C3347|nr:PREDICTED: uncharacterized protein LOC108549773 [Eufriesea mexicana]